MTYMEIERKILWAHIKAFFYATFHPGTYIRIETEYRGRCGVNYTEIVRFVGVVDKLEIEIIRRYYGKSNTLE